MSVKFLALALLVLLAGCQSAQKKNLELLGDRVRKLRPLSSAETQKCTLEVSLTQPASARYKEMFPKEKIEEPWTYTWRGSEARCEIAPRCLKPRKGFWTRRFVCSCRCIG